MPFKFVNGVMVKEPEATAASAPVPVAIAVPLPSSSATKRAPPVAVATAPPMAVVCNTEQLYEATLAADMAGITLKTDPKTVATLERFADQDFSLTEFAQKYQSPDSVDGQDILFKIGRLFAKYEIPIGLLSKVVELSNYNINFIIDDSGSMGSTLKFAKKGSVSGYMYDFYQRTLRPGWQEESLTRFEEAEDICHILIDILAYVPTGTITVHFFNRDARIPRNKRLVLDRAGRTPDKFCVWCHDVVHTRFASGPPEHGTPLYRELEEAFKYSVGKTMHYVVCDGEDSTHGTEALGRLIANRSNAENNPVSLLGCTDDPSDVEWMEEVERSKTFVCTTDYFEEEKLEIAKFQGDFFPFSRGLWLLCMLVGAISPDDLDTLLDPYPLTKYTLEIILGRELTQQEYEKYWSQNPNSFKYATMYMTFCAEKRKACDFIGKPRFSFSGMVGSVLKQRRGSAW
jgi:hypothetical protein